MPHPPTARPAAAVAVPAFEVDGGLLALLPKTVVAEFDGRRSGVHFVVVGESRGSTAAIAELKKAANRLYTTDQTAGSRPWSRADRVATNDPARFAKGSRAGGEPAVDVLLARITRALTRAAGLAGDAFVHQALERSSDMGAVIDLLRSTLPLLSAERELDPDLDARVAALAGEDDLIRRAGSLKDIKWVADYLAISPKSVAAKARRKELLAIPRGDRNLYPAIQFRDGQVLPGLREVLQALPLTNGWSQLSFLLAANPGLDDRTPLDALETGRAAVLAVATNIHDQGAA